jgi:class 3 adenylate cyclase
MKCNACQTENDDDDQFCAECGTPLIAQCSKCAAQLKPNAKFCTKCGATTAKAEPQAPDPQPDGRSIAEYTPKHLAEKILTSRSAIEGERKQVTILFADVKGSMDLAGQLDPEQWHDLLNRFFDILNHCVHRFEGTVNQYTGDGIMAIFGAPIAHEDHAQRACYAALQMCEELRRFSVDLRIDRGLDFATRIGVNSGEVVVGKIGDDLRMDYTAQGQTVGVAQRLEQLAEVGHAYVSEATANLAQGFFDLTDLGASTIAGLEAPTKVFDLIGSTTLRTRFDVSRARGLTRFVGRHDEMGSLNSALARARDGHGQVVGVVGEPGLGKSRLCFEFVERCRNEGLAVYTAHCPAHGKSIPFIPILELLRSYFEIADDDSPEQVRKKIAGSLLLLDPEMHTTLPVFFDFLGVPDPDRPAEALDSDARQRQIFEIVHKVTRIQHERGVASITFIDDLHWIDSWSDEFVAQLVEACQQSHTLLLVNFRPEYQAPWTVKPHYQQLPLVPLGEDAVREMLDSVLGGDDSVVALAAKIMQWTGGNPLFTEEVINTLVETQQLVGIRGAYTLNRDIGALEVPLTVQAIIAARIDRLDDTAKLILHCAAVIGKEFRRDLIESISELSGGDFSNAVERLKLMDFIYETSLYPNVEYTFKHPSVHEVAYDAQLHEQRAARHRRVAETIESSTDQLDDHAVRLAYHWDLSGAHLKALEWHRRAGTLLQLTDASSATAHWRRVREIVDIVESTPAVLSIGAEACAQLTNLAWREGGSEAESQAFFEDGRLMAKRAGNDALLATLTGYYAAFRGVSLGYAKDYADYSLEATQIARHLDDPELHYSVMSWRIWGSAFMGQLDEAQSLSEEIITKTAEHELSGLQYSGTSLNFSGYIGTAFSSIFLGDKKRALEGTRKAVPHATASADTTAFPPVLEGTVHYLYGQFDAGNDAFGIGIDYAEKAGSSYARVAASGHYGACLTIAGRLEEANSFLNHAIDLMEAENTAGANRGFIVAGRVRTLIASGDPERGRTLAAELIDYCQKRHLFWAIDPWLAHASACTALGDSAGALASLQEA